MRISLAGPIDRLDPVVLIFDTPGSFTFDKTQYPDYTNYDVIVIGAGGGKGSDLVSSGVKGYGGEGGGGGLHRRQGLLEILANSIAVTVGAGGADGVTNANGADGGHSSFGTIARATGAMGGKKCVSVATDLSIPPANDGGDGGIGGLLNIVTYSGVRYAGAPGGLSGFADLDVIGGVSQTTRGTTGGLTQGPVLVGASLTYTDDGLIGLGGGGGAGGLQGVLLGTSGGKGSYSADESLFSPGGPPSDYDLDSTHSYLIVPGKAGGARITPLNGSDARYGDSGSDGVVALRLTAE